MGVQDPVGEAGSAPAADEADGDDAVVGGRVAAGAAGGEEEAGGGACGEDADGRGGPA